MGSIQYSSSHRPYLDFSKIFGEYPVVFYKEDYDYVGL